jgi:hypothetical protein
MSFTPPAGYYNQYDPTKEFEKVLVVAGRGIQSAEINEIQDRAADRRRAFGDSLYRDGDIIRDCQCSVAETTGVARLGSGAIYLQGEVRGVPTGGFSVPITGTVAIGVRLISTVITATDDATLLDPAAGTPNYQLVGGDRLKIHAQWGWDKDGVSNDGGGGQFFPVYTVIEGVLLAKQAPPSIDPITQQLAQYDRDSAGGMYVVSGLQLKILPDDGIYQVYSLSQGAARVFGFPLNVNVARRLRYALTPDVRHIVNEPYLSTTNAAQRINFADSPGSAPSQVTITKLKTVTLTHGVTTGASDAIPDTSVLAITAVTQGATTYASTTDYKLTGGAVDWSPAGAEPSPGSTYSVTYQYITVVTPTAVDSTGFTVTGAVTGTLVLTTYDQLLPRLDRLCLGADGSFNLITGVPATSNPQLPAVPPDQLPLSTIVQTWDANRSVLNDGVRVVAMPQIAGIFGRLDLLTQLIAQQRLSGDLYARSSAIKKGLFVDPFLDDSMRDAGIAQTGAVFAGELTLPITPAILQMGSDITGPVVLPYGNNTALEQTLLTGSMQINPFLSFAPVPATLTLAPAIDRWTTVDTEWASPISNRFDYGGGGFSGFAGVQGNGNGGGSSAGSYTTTSSINKALINDVKINTETTRAIAVSFSIRGFGPGESLAQMTFDSVDITPAGLVADASGVITGTFNVPAGLPSGVKLVSVKGSGGSGGSAQFTSQGTVDRQTWQQQTTITSTWQAAPPANNSGSSGFVVGPSSGSINPGQQLILGGTGDGGGIAPANASIYYPSPFLYIQNPDPLAQTFTLPRSAQISGVGLYFSARPTGPIRVQIRDTSGGVPGQNVMVEKIIPAADVLIGINGSAPETQIIFAAPQLLVGGTEYAIVVLCNDAAGALNIAELGKFDTINQQWITSQPYTVGVLLASSNAVTWTPYQDRDMTFRLLRASYTTLTRTVSLGSVAVTGATDLMLMAYADRPAAGTFADFVLSLPDGSTQRVTDGQNFRLSAPVTGNVGVSCVMQGVTDFSPILIPGSQLVAGVVASTGDYATVAVPGGTAVTMEVILDALVPSGATLQVQWRGDSVGDVWADFPAPTQSPADNGFTEFVYTQTGITKPLLRAHIVLNGTPAARPRVRDLRVIVY